MSWYAKRFANGCIALNARGRTEDFKEVFEAFADTRHGAAVFSRHHTDGSVTAYFTPVSHEFARMIQAAAIGTPVSEGLTLLCGNPDEMREARRNREGGRNRSRR